MTIGRVSLPAEFFDRTSEKMLVQPEPQYLYARLLFMGSAAAELRRSDVSVGINPDRGPGTMGAAVPDLLDMQLLLADNIRSEALFVSDELAPGKVGHTIRMNRPVFSGGGYTEASRTIAAGTSISTSPIDVTEEQVSLTIKRVVGPFAASGSVPQPYAIDRFDAQHSVHNLAAIVGLNLARDRMKYIDAVIGALFDTVAVTVYPGDATFALSTDASALIANGDRPFDAETVFRAEQKAADAYIPRFANGMYMMTLTPQQVRQLRSDPQFQRLAVFDKDRNPLAKSYVGTLGGVELYVSSTNTVDTTTVSGVSIHHGLLFGPGHVGYASSGPCRTASANEDNYGETAKVIWLAYEGAACLDNRLAIAVHSD